MLPAFTCLGHECQDLLSMCDGMHRMYRPDLGLYSHLKKFLGNGVRTHVNSERKILSTGDSDRDTALHRTRGQKKKRSLYFEGSRPGWCISSMMYSGDTSFWSETLSLVLPMSVKRSCLFVFRRKVCTVFSVAVNHPCCYHCAYL